MVSQMEEHQSGTRDVGHVRCVAHDGGDVTAVKPRISCITAANDVARLTTGRQGALQRMLNEQGVCRRP